MGQDKHRTKSLLGKSPPHLNSLVTIAATTTARAPAGIFHWSSPKPIPPLAIFPSSSLLPMTGTNCKNRWSWRLLSPSPTSSTSCQSSSQIIAPVHSPSVNSPSNYLIPILYFLFFYFAPFHPAISTCTFIFCTSITPVLNCYIVITSPLWPILLPCLPYLTSFAHTVYTVPCESIRPPWTLRPFLWRINNKWDTIMKWNDIYWIFQTFLTNQKLKNWACKIIQPP